MRPFRPSFPDKTNTQGGNNPALQQAMLFNHNPLGFNNQFQVPQLPYGLNPQFPNPAMGNFSHNVQPIAQNNQLGVLPSFGQFTSHNPAHNLSQAIAMQLQNTQPQFLGHFNMQGQLRPNLPSPLQQGGLFWAQNPVQNFNQIMSLQNGQTGLENPMLQGNPLQCLQNSVSSHPPMGNLQLAQNNSNSRFGNAATSFGAMQLKNQAPCGINAPSTTCQSAMSVASNVLQNSLPPSSSSPVQAHWNGNSMKPSGPQQPQVIQAGRNNKSNAISENCSRKNFRGNFHGFGNRESSHMRFQKPQFHDTRNMQGKKPFERNGGRGGKQTRRGRKPKFEESSTVSPRSLPVNYTAKEIRQWREARKKNYPTRTMINKKSGICEDIKDAGDEAKVRRQELKEVLAKQAELGVEVAEIPPSYLSEPENEVHRNEKKRKGMTANGQFPGKGKNKRLRGRKPKFFNKTTAVLPPVVKREPSLLQKLLSADIKRDRSRVLQVFRFMVLNSFFKSWPEKPLEFPLITVTGEDDIGEITLIEDNDGQKDSTVVDQAANQSSEGHSEDGIGEDEVGNLPVGKADGIGDQFEKSEEGELTE